MDCMIFKCAASLALAHRGPDDFGTIILCETAPEPLEIGLGNPASRHP